MAGGMTDYSVKVTVRNGRILRLMRAAGIETQTELARRAGVGVNYLNAIIALRERPTLRDGQYREVVERIAGILNCDPDDMFSDAQRDMALASNSHVIEMDEAQVAMLAAPDMEASSWVRLEVQRLIAATELSEREIEIVEGINAGETLDDVGSRVGVSRERVRQIHIKALRKLKATGEMMDRAAGDAIALGRPMRLIGKST